MQIVNFNKKNLSLPKIFFFFQLKIFHKQGVFFNISQKKLNQLTYSTLLDNIL